MGSPHDLGKHVAKNMVKNGMASGWACLLANSKKCTGGHLRTRERRSALFHLSHASPPSLRLAPPQVHRRHLRRHVQEDLRLDRRPHRRRPAHPRQEHGVRRVQAVQVQPHRADLHLLRHRLRQHRRHRPEPRPPPRAEGGDGGGGEGVRRRARAGSFGGEIEQPRSLSRPTHLVSVRACRLS